MFLAVITSGTTLQRIDNFVSNLHEVFVNSVYGYSETSFKLEFEIQNSDIVEKENTLRVYYNNWALGKYILEGVYLSINETPTNKIILENIV